jgi:hypothetical protein
VRWAGHIARRGETRNGGIVLVGNFKGKSRLQDAVVGDGKIILNCIFKKEVGTLWTGLNWLIAGTGGGSFEHGNVLSCFIKGEKFLEQLREY